VLPLRLELNLSVFYTRFTGVVREQLADKFADGPASATLKCSPCLQGISKGALGGKHAYRRIRTLASLVDEQDNVVGVIRGVQVADRRLSLTLDVRSSRLGRY
jgi:hypothetical protein